MKARWTMAAALLVGLVAVRALQAEDAPNLKGVKCPISGKDVVADGTADFNGGKVYFCCKNCPEAFKKDTAKFATKANHQMAQTGQLKQKACPISGKECKAGTEVDVNGVKVAFCCNNCKGAAEKMTADERMAKFFADVSKTFELAAKK